MAESKPPRSASLTSRSLEYGAKFSPERGLKTSDGLPGMMSLPRFVIVLSACGS